MENKIHLKVCLKTFITEIIVSDDLKIPLLSILSISLKDISSVPWRKCNSKYLFQNFQSVHNAKQYLTLKNPKKDNQTQTNRHLVSQTS